MNRLVVVSAAFVAGAMLVTSPVTAANSAGASTQAATPPVVQNAPEETSTQDAASSSYERRANSIVEALDIQDSAKAGRVHDVIAAQYRAIHDWHAANDKTRKAASTQPDSDQAKQIQASYQALHDHFISALSAELTPEEMDRVKEKMTGGQMTATLRNYPTIVPNLTDEEKAMVQSLLLQAREDAIDSASKTERVAIFKKYKGKINNYLNAHGHNVAQAYKDWGAAQKAKNSGAATQPEANSSGN